MKKIMSDFMKWLYANYIKPDLDTIPRGDYEADFYLLEDERVDAPPTASLAVARRGGQSMRQPPNPR